MLPVSAGATRCVTCPLNLLAAHLSTNFSDCAMWVFSIRPDPKTQSEAWNFLRPSRSEAPLMTGRQTGAVLASSSAGPEFASSQARKHPIQDSGLTGGIRFGRAIGFSGEPQFGRAFLADRGHAHTARALIRAALAMALVTSLRGSQVCLTVSNRCQGKAGCRRPSPPLRLSGGGVRASPSLPFSPSSLRGRSAGLPCQAFEAKAELV